MDQEALEEKLLGFSLTRQSVQKVTMIIIV